MKDKKEMKFSFVTLGLTGVHVMIFSHFRQVISNCFWNMADNPQQFFVIYNQVKFTTVFTSNGDSSKLKFALPCLVGSSQLDPIVGSNVPKSTPIYASLGLAFHPRASALHSTD